MTRLVTQAELIKKSFQIQLIRVATGIPGQVVSFDPVTQYAQVQIGVRELDSSTQALFEPSLLIDCYVQCYGGKWSVETQIDPGDEGMIHFSQRCIDGWMMTGGIADNPRPLQTHDLSDCVFYPGGARSEPGRLSNFTNNGIRLRNIDGSLHIWLKNDNSVIITADSLTVEADTTINGTLAVNGSSMTHNGTNVGDDHNHASGSYVVGSTPVTGTSGDPV